MQKTMNNNKQSSVEWLIKKLQNREKGIFDGLPHLSLDEIYNQAKAMHKEEHDKTSEVWFNEGTNVHNGRKYQNFEQYYNETYGGNK